MGNKGFTLVELLATIVIIGIVMGIAVNGVIHYIHTSKLKSEKIFVDKIENALKSYLAVKGSSLTEQEDLPVLYRKCLKVGEEGGSTNSCKDVKVKNFGTINLSVITKSDDEFEASSSYSKEDLINPKNNENCLSGSDPNIRVFRDDDFVYYYYLDLKDSSCDIDVSNQIVSNLPKDLVSNLPKDLCDKLSLDCGGDTSEE